MGMATLKDIVLKIGAVKKTKQITKAMNMVAASRLRGAQTNMEAFRPYAGKFAEVLGSLAKRAGDATNPLLVPKEKVNNIHLVLCISDRGLCGGFNANLIEKARSFMKEKTAAEINFTFTNFGKKGRDWCRRENLQIDSQHLGVVGTTFGFHIASAAGKKLVDAFLEGTYDEVHILYAEVVTMARQLPVLKQLLPIPPIETGEGEETEESDMYLAEHICEPSAGSLFADMLPRNVYVQIYSALLETSTSEHAARMMAMDNATKACNDMLENLTLIYNKARQAAITAELMDIVGGAEALRG
jgi:F-type H+-transporting ATPase subunit gamma